MPLLQSLLPRPRPRPRDTGTDSQTIVSWRRETTRYKAWRADCPSRAPTPNHTKAKANNQHPSIQASAILVAIGARSRPSFSSSAPNSTGAAVNELKAVPVNFGYVGDKEPCTTNNEGQGSRCTSCMSPRFARTRNQTDRGKGTIARLLLRRQRTHLIEHDQAMGIQCRDDS